MSARKGQRAEPQVEAASTREKLLEAARAEFSQNGIKATKIAVICRRANLANGTFYLHFRTKEDVWAELLAETAEELATRLAKSGANTELDARVRDRIEVGIIVGFAEERSDLYSFILSERSGQIKAHDLFLERFIEQRRAMIARGIEAGDFRPELDPTAAALADYGMATETIQWWLKNRDRMTREQLVECLVDMRARMFFPD
jgi:AcrR family transcriptional regulator